MKPMKKRTFSGKRRYDQNTAVDDLMNLLQKAGRQNFNALNVWESCLCALVLALDPKCKTYRLLESLPAHNRALDEIDTLGIVSNLGYFPRRTYSSLGDIDPRLLPCLFISDKGTPAIVLSDEGDSLKLYKNRKLSSISKHKAGRHKGALCVFERYDENRASTSRFVRGGSGQSWFHALLSRFKDTFKPIMLSGLMVNLISLTTPLFIMLVYDRVIAAGAINILPMLALGVGIAIAFEWALRGVRSKALSWFATRTDNIVSNKIFSHLIGLPPQLIEQASVASQIARLKTFETVRDFFSGSVFLSLLEIPFVILAALLIYAVAGPLVLVPIAVIAAYCCVFWLFHRHIRVAIRMAAKATSARQQFAIETFEKIRGIRGYGLTAKWNSKFRELSGREMIFHFHLNWLGMTAETVAHTLTLLSAVATIGFGVHMIWAGAMTTGALVACMILVWRVLTPFYSLCTMIPRLEQLRNSVSQVNRLMDMDTEAMEAKTAARLPRMQGRVTFENVSLSYGDKSQTVFSGLHLEAMPGSLVMITGTNGSGKSSILKLIQSMHKAQDGAVRIDGFDIRQLDMTDLRRHIAYLPQQPDFFQGTILDNLRFSNPMATREEIEAALQTADAYEDVLKLPDGVETVIGKYTDDRLSSSLAARLSLARIYLHPSQIILIDELPNSILSSRSGKNLKDFMNRMKGKKTVFMVTYREDFMKMADTILFLKQGQTPLTGSAEMLQNTKTREVA